MNVDHLKNARKKSGMTQQEAAKSLGVGQSTYKNYECGYREPNGDTIVMLADLFHVTTDYLLGRDTGEPETIDSLAIEFNMTALEKKILDNYLLLPPAMRENLMDFLHKSVKEVMDESNS
jgi:transcriptional regulator with XRE-family HTH domain